MVEMNDEELREAVVEGRVDFLKECVAAKKPNEYYLTVFPKRYSGDEWYGNILHIAAVGHHEELIREAIDCRLLPPEVVQQLLCQTRSEEDKENPLHIAARKEHNVEIVKMFLNAFITNKDADSSSLRVPPSQESSDAPNYSRPWLMKNRIGCTPCHTALYYGQRECGLEILRMDKELLSNMVDICGNSLLFLALENELTTVAAEIVSSSHSFSSCGSGGLNALHIVATCTASEGKDICRLLLKKVPELITQTSDEGMSIFHGWASFGKIWPFQYLLESNDIIPNIRQVFAKLISVVDNGDANPLHYLPQSSSIREELVEIGKLLIDTYRHETQTQASSSISTGELKFPWLVQDAHKKTTLDYAMDNGFKEFAKMILLEDDNALETCQGDVLFTAIEKSFHEVQHKILEIVERKGLTRLLTNSKKQNVLHLAPKCQRNIFEWLLKHFANLIEGIDESGETILHTWVTIGQVWPFEYLLNSHDIDFKWRLIFISRIDYCDNINKNYPLHVAAMCTHESTLQIVKLLTEAYGKMKGNSVEEPIMWDKNKDGEGALHLAIRCQKDQKLALHLLSLLQNDEDLMARFLDCYAPKEHLILFLAVEKNFTEVVKAILTTLSKERWSKYLYDSSNDTNILHLASTLTDRKFGQWLVEEAPVEFITQQDKSRMTPLDNACADGIDWLVKLMLDKDPSLIFNKQPFAWVKACENGHASVIPVFIDCCPIKFSDHCKQHHDSPLHHIKLRNLTRYEDFLKIQYMKDLLNVQDSDGTTPLHKAIANQNIFLAEALLKMDEIRYNIKNNEGKTARLMLAEFYNEPKPQWVEMCKSIGFDPNLETQYFERKTDLLEVRNTLSLVAALLATITFTAGFTLPGGLNEDTGEAMIVNKVAFVAFLISDTLALCFSMVVLVCLVWSMVFDPNQSLYLIDRSVGLLRLALYLTLLAFVTGVYIVISPKLLWVAILIIVLCSLVGVSANRNLLYKVFTLADKILSFVKKKCMDLINRMVNKKPEDSINRMELGLSLLSHGGESSNPDRAIARDENRGLV